MNNNLMAAFLALFFSHVPVFAQSQISAEFPYESQFVEVDGSRIHYVEVGDGKPILLIHGNPTSSYLWRNVIPFLAPQGRVIALDLIGMGKSDKPDIDYTYHEHVSFLKGFIEELALRNITLVLHDAGSLLGFDYASRNEENVAGIAFMESAVPPGFPPASYEALGPVAPIFRAWRTPGVGEDLLLEQNQFIEQILPRSIVRSLTEGEMASYREPYPDARSRRPILAWPRGMPIGGEPADNQVMLQHYSEWMTRTNLPMLHLWASPGALNPEPVATWLVENLHDLESVFVGEGIHYLQEDHPEVIGRAIADWIRRTTKDPTPE